MRQQCNKRVCAYVDLEAIRWNLDQIKGNIDKESKIVAVIKADGYGHGSVPIAQAVEPLDYIWGFAVATAGEAFTLRDSGIKKNILILGYTFEEDYPELCRQEIIPAVFTWQMAENMSRVAEELEKTMAVHLALDTGMTRIGFQDNDESVEECCKIARLPGIEIQGMFTHFARADEFESTPTRNQFERYNRFADRLKAAGVPLQYRHCSNSAGIMNFSEANLDLCRAGIIMYGLFPSDEVYVDKIHLKPAMELKSHVVHVKDVASGVPISYGGTFVTERQMRVATIPVGYGDGYPRSLSNKGYVLIRGQKAPILGRVCMDQFMVDVSHIPGVEVLDEVTLVGRDGEQVISMEELGDLSGRFNYEFACDLTARVPRVYL